MSSIFQKKEVLKKKIKEYTKVTGVLDRTKKCPFCNDGVLAVRKCLVCGRPVLLQCMNCTNMFYVDGEEKHFEPKWYQRILRHVGFQYCWEELEKG